MLDRPEARDPETPFTSPDEKAVACAITITTQVGSNRSIVVQSYMERDAPANMFHDVLDKLNKVVDRQEAKLQLEGLDLDLDKHRKKLVHMAEDFQNIEARAERAWNERGKKGAFRLSEAELTQKTQAGDLLKRMKEEIARLEVEIAKVRGVIADVD